MNGIDELFTSWVEAERSCDSSALEQLLDRDFQGIGPLGFVLVRQQWIDRYAHGDLVNHSFDWVDTSTREFGETAIVTGMQAQKSQYREHPSDGQFRGTLTAVHREDGWKVANLQLSMLGAPPAGFRPPAMQEASS